MAEDKSRRIDQINSKPGFGRDGTMLDTPSFVDGQWCRFQRGRPKKMGGYQEIAGNVPDICRGAYAYAKNGLTCLYGFAKGKMWSAATNQQCITTTALSSVLADYSDGREYSYQVDSIYDATGTGVASLLVHGSPNLQDIASEENMPIYACAAGMSGATMAPISNGEGGTVDVSGGVVVLQPYVFAYGNAGLVKNSQPNNPNDWVVSASSEANEVNVAGTKIVKGLPLRGGAAAPAGLFWSLDSLIRVSRAGSEFRYDTLSSQTTVLSPSSIVEYDGVYYWLGTDRFLKYDGTVSEVPNAQNYNWFFDNLNYAQRTKVWALKNTRYGEIWWFFPFGNATECTHALIYNIRENCWYDTQHARSAGHASQVLRYPLTWGAAANSYGTYSCYVEERGRNAIEAGQELAIASWFETCDFGYPTGGAGGEQPAGSDYWTRLYRVEPDFVQRGIMSLIVKGREFAQGQITQSEPYSFEATTERIDMREQRRQISLRFESNVLNGDFYMGRVILHTEPGDIRS